MKIAASTADGREQTVGLVYKNEFVGQPFAARAEFTVTALTETDLCLFSRINLERMLHEHVAVERQLLRQMARALDDTRSRMLTLARASASERIAGFLIEMAKRAGRGVNRSAPAFELPLTRGQIAEVLGLTIETVSRQLGKLKDAGIIVLPGARSVIILDHDALEARAA